MFKEKNINHSVAKNGSKINTTYYDEIKLLWTNTILNGTTFEKALHDGFFIKKNNKKLTYSDNVDEVVKRLPGKKNNTGLELHLYSKTGIGDGQQANNPWLQEFPDPISRVTWDNYLTISTTDASNLGLKNINQSDGALDGSVAIISLNGIDEKVPVIIFFIFKSAEKIKKIKVSNNKPYAE